MNLLHICHIYQIYNTNTKLFWVAKHCWYFHIKNNKISSRIREVRRILRQIKMVEVLGLPTGEMRGDYFEMAVFNYITTAGRLKFEYTSCAKTSTVELTSPELQKETLHVAHVPEIKKDVNACCHVPHLKGGDIILVYGKKVYFIQCSVATYDNVLKKKGFMDVAKPEWIEILVTPYDLSKDLHGKKVSFHKIIWQINSALHAPLNSCRFKLLKQFISQMEIRSVSSDHKYFYVLELLDGLCVFLVLGRIIHYWLDMKKKHSLSIRCKLGV